VAAACALVAAIVPGFVVPRTVPPSRQRYPALLAEARSRLNTAYMTCAFLGGSVGSWLGTRAYTGLGWTGVCGLVASPATLALGRHLVHRRRAAPAVPAPGQRVR
jgi:hypothetical protein